MNLSQQVKAEVNAVSEACAVGVLKADKFNARTIDELFQPSEIPTRQWLIQDYLLKGSISLIVAEGGVGKSTLSMINAMSVAAGKDLLGIGDVEQANVLLINNEDDDNELERRISAICQFYNLDAHKELSHRFLDRKSVV